MNSLHQTCITVYCASSSAIDKQYIIAAKELGRKIALRNCAVVCGAGRQGLMGAVIDGALEENGTTIGVIPQFMVDNNWHHPQLTHTIITPDMHQRKQRMANLSQAVIALPGGCGTLEELLEIITWRQLGLYKGNIVILNTLNYYDNLIAMLDNAIQSRFMKPSHAQLWQVAETPEQAIEQALSNQQITIQSKY